MPDYPLSEVCEIAHGNLVGESNIVIRHLITDSRKITTASDSLFFAIVGVRHDGHNYINDLYRLGTRAFVVEKLPANLSSYKEAGFVRVNDSLQALQALAGFHRQKFTKPVVGITGSNGKTILKEWIYQAIHTDKSVVRSPKSYNSQVGVPLSLWSLDQQYDLAIIEAGISQPGEMEKLQCIVRPDIGIITNIGEPHQENFSTLNQKAREKLLLFTNCKTILYCADHEVIANAIKEGSLKNKQAFTWSANGTANVNFNTVSKTSESSVIQGIFQQTGFEFKIPFTDHASVENCLHLISFLFFMKYDSEAIQKRLAQLTPVAMRLELKHGFNNCTIINDSYNSDLGSLTIALDYLQQQNQHETKTVILSDILQSGKRNDLLYAEVGNLIKSKQVKRFIGIGNEITNYRNLFDGNSRFFHTTDEFLGNLGDIKFSNETILLKGSRVFEFERILKELEEKAHETVLEINLDALVHNLNYFRSRLKPGVKVIAMVKAFSYGSGSFEIANIMQFQRVDYLAVAFADEGVSLRDSGISVPIMVMNPEQRSFDAIIRYRLEPEIYSFRELYKFCEEVKNHSLTYYPVHIKLDSGMHRLGFMPDDTDRLVDYLASQNFVSVKSVFSHLAGSDEAQFDSFTREQINAFSNESEKFLKRLPGTILRHISNSAGVERFPEAQFDMVRLGIGLYGISAIGKGLLRQVSTLKTVILQIKDIQPNETVGYSRRFKAVKPTRIGILPIGYADGLHRILGNGVGKLWVNGTFVPIIGSICMDMCMIDLTGANAREGDEVIVFGDENPLSEIAEQMKTIPYEVLTSISRRVKRVYYQE